MSIALRLLLAALATYRLARLLALEDGPLVALDNARVPLLAYIRSEVANLDMDDDGNIKYGLLDLVKCPYCLGVWLAPVLALTAHSQLLSRIILAPLAVMGLQALLLDATRLTEQRKQQQLHTHLA